MIGIHGGSSGGGSVNLFIRNEIDSGIQNTFNVTGGGAVWGGGSYRTSGGAGGTGTVTIGTIVNGYYTKFNL